ncbi:MFS transporter [Chloroflexota bacterium]
MLSFRSISKDRIYYGWVVVSVLLIILSMILGTRYTFGVFFKSIASEFDLTRAATSGIFSTLMVLCSVFAVLGGWALDRYGPRIIFFIMGIFISLSLLLTSQTYTAWQLLVTYSFLLAMGTGAGFALVTATASKWFVKKRGLALGIALSGEGLGTLVMPPIAAYLIADLGWRTALLIIGLMAGVVIINLSLLLKDNPSLAEAPNRVTPPHEYMKAPRSDEGQLISYSLLAALKTNSFWFLWVIWFLFSLCWHLVLTHIVPYTTDIGISATISASILALIGGITIPSRLIMGWISDRIGRKLTATICASIQALAMIWLALSSELWMLYMFAAIYGLSFGGLSTMIAVLISETFGLKNLGVITGALVVGFATGAAVGPLIAGLIYDVSNEYFIAFIVGAAAMLLVALIMPLIKRKEMVQ